MPDSCFNDVTHAFDDSSLFPKFSRPNLVITISSNENSNFNMIMRRSVKEFQVGTDVIDSVKMSGICLNNLKIRFSVDLYLVY